MAAAGDDFLDDDDFAEYNPHPYRGGYDLATTYGSPLPPSSSTCYPVSIPIPTAPAPSPLAPARPQSPPVVEPYKWPEPYDYGEAPREPMYPTPEVFRGWPYWAGAEGNGGRGGGCCGRDYWRQCMRGLDYLFGHSDGYGERRIGTDSYGVPVYANRKGGGEEAVVVEVAPAAVGKVQSHDAGEEPVHSNRLSWYDDGSEETYAYGQPMYRYYDVSSQEQSYSLHGVLDEPTLFPKVSYELVNKEEEPQYQEFLSYDAESKIFGQPIYCYNQHFYEQPLNVLVEDLEPVCTQKLEYYENFPTYHDQRDNCILETSTYSYEIQSHAQFSDAPLEPFKPSWSRNLSFYQACIEGEALDYANQSPVSGEYGGMDSLFVSSYYPHEIQEQSNGDEHASFQQHWHNLNNWNILSEDVSQVTKSGDDSYYLNGSFWPFGEYSTCNV